MYSGKIAVPPGGGGRVTLGQRQSNNCKATTKQHIN
jgi:hypothetical protein